MKPPIALLFLVPLLMARRGGGGGGAGGSNLKVYKPVDKDKDKGATLRDGPTNQATAELFEAAAVHLGLPKSWAHAESFRRLLSSESGGRVGIPNFTYGNDIGKHPEKWPAIWNDLRNGIYKTNSSATGLGQLLASNTDKFYPDGRAGIGDPWNEAVGMLAYINKRWTSPDRAWECYEANVCFSGPGVSGYGAKTWRGY